MSYNFLPQALQMTPRTFIFKDQAIYTQTYQNHTQNLLDNTINVYIFLHGWMDNLASFTPVIESIFKQTDQPFTFVAIDLPGHGKSDHSVGLNAYNIWSDISTVMAVVDQLGLSSFGLFGHSRGAMIATLIAGTFAERVTDLFLIESIIAPIDKPVSAPATLRDSVDGQIKLLSKKQNYYSTFEQAVNSRANGIINVPYDDALTLAKHGVKKAQHGYYWDMDAMLRAPSEVKLSLHQTNAFFDAINANITLVLGDDGLIIHNKNMMAWINNQTKFKPHIVTGGHHLHMSQAHSEVAQYFINCIT